MEAPDKEIEAPLEKGVAEPAGNKNEEEAKDVVRMGDG